MEPMAVERHRRGSPRRLRERERANGASGKRCDIDAAMRRSQTENWELRANQSKPKLKHVPECQRLTGLKNRSWREWSRWQSSDIDEARTVSAGASEWSQREAVRHRRSKAEVADRELGRSSQSHEP